MKRPWARGAIDGFRALDLRAHRILADVPLHDVWQVSLPGEERLCTMTELRAVASTVAGTLSPIGPVAALFALRRLLGGMLQWDAPVPSRDAWSYGARLTEEDRERSLVPPGTLDGPFSVLYVHDTEAVSEIRNSTVHAFLVWAVRPVAGGHELIWATHVRPVSRWSGAYLTAIEPFRRWIVYPTLLARFHDIWMRQATK